MKAPTRSVRITLLLAALLAGPASFAMPVAQPPVPESALPSRLAEEYRQADLDADGSISHAEYLAGKHRMTVFREADGNCDARLDPQEYGTARAIERRERVAGYLGDAWLTTRVKFRLLLDDLPSGLGIAVRSHEGTVRLSGRLGDAREASRAIEVASRVEGVVALYAALSLRG